MEEYRRGRLQSAQAGLREALAIAEGSADRRGEAWALQSLAWVQTTLGDFADAEVTLARSARLFAELGNATGRAWLRGTTAFARLLAGRLHEARHLAEAFLPFGERVGEHWAVGTLRAVAAFADAQLGDLAAAEAQARQADEEFDVVDDEWGHAFVLLVRGVVAREQGQPERAADLFDQARVRGGGNGHPLLLGLANTLHGFTVVETGDAAAAEKDARAVLDVAGPYGAAEAVRMGPRVLLGRARLADGDVTGAVGILGEVATALQDGEPASVLISPRRSRSTRRRCWPHNAPTRRWPPRAAPWSCRARMSAAGASPTRCWPMPSNAPVLTAARPRRARCPTPASANSPHQRRRVLLRGGWRGCSWRS